MSCVVGDIVVRRYSAAKHLKNKVYKVIGFVRGGYSNGVVLLKPSGGQIKLEEYWVQTLEMEIRRAECNVSTAEKNVTKAMNKLATLKSEAQEVRKLFPEV